MKLNPTWPIILSLVVCCALNCPAQALTMDKLYTVVIQVPDNSYETRAKVLPAAFEQLFRKIASSHSVLNHAEVIAAAAQADNYVNNYFYKEQAGGYLLTLQFNELMLENLLANIGRASLGKNRPQVLLWIVLEENNQPVFVTASTHEQLANKVDLLANNYGLPLILPLLDLTERLFITEQDVINFNDAPLQQASERYNTDAILLGKINHLAGAWHCEWRLIDGTRSASWTSTGNDLDAELDLMVNNLAGHIIAGHGKLRNNTGETFSKSYASVKQGVNLLVTGIECVADYAKTLEHLKHNSALKEVEIGSVNGNQATFLIVAEGGRDAIIRALSTDSLLIIDNSKPKTNAQELKYTLYHELKVDS